MISIIIPILNEVDIIEKLLQHISESASTANILEILVVDGGSNDGSKDLIKTYSESSHFKIRLITSEKGRARQMNTGAHYASGTILYFLHADSFPPKQFDTQIISEVKKGNLFGCFRMKFDKSHAILNISQWFTRFNYKFCRGGDQSLYVTANVFSTLNGFNETYEVYEDCEFINRLYDHGSFTVINDFIVTSARRYNANGTWKLQYHFAVIHLKKWCGYSPKNLYNYYKKYIA